MTNIKTDKILNVPTLRFPGFTDEWQKKKLCSIAKLSKGTGISKEDKSDYGSPCILYGELYTTYNSEIINDVVSKTELHLDNLVQSESNDVIIPSSGESAIDISTARCVITSGVLLGGDLNIIRLYQDDGRFLCYQLNSVRKLDIAKVAQGVSVVHLYGDALKSISVSLPHIDEQKKIADFLSLLDERIELQSKLIYKLQSLIKGLNQQLLTKCDSWNTYQLKDIALIKSGYSGTQINAETPFKVSRIETISQHYIDMQRIGYVQEVPKNYKLNIGDILFSNINSVQYIGNTAYIDKEYDLYHGMNLLRIVPNATIVLPRFLHLLFCTRKAINHFQTICNKAVSQASINQTDLGKSQFAIPTMETQHKICQIFEGVKNKIENEQLILIQQKRQKESLLKQLFI